MTRNLAVEFRIAANTLRRLTSHPDPQKAERAKAILEDPALFRAFVDRRSQAERDRRRSQAA